MVAASHPDLLELEKAKKMLKVKILPIVKYNTCRFNFVTLSNHSYVCRSMNKHCLMSLRSLRTHVMMEVVMQTYFLT